MTKTQTIEAVYENGVLHPLQALVGVAEHSKVKIIVDLEVSDSHPLLQFAGILNNQEASELQATIAQEFGQVDLNGW